MQSLKLKSQEKPYNTQSNIIYLKKEYRDEVILSQEKALKKVDFLKLSLFLILILISLINLFSLLSNSFMLIGLFLVYHLFICGTKVILHNYKPTINVYTKKTSKKYKGISDKEIKIIKEYSSKYKRYTKDLSKYM